MSLRLECNQPDFIGNTVGDLLTYTTQLIDTLEQCNSQIQAQNEWYRLNTTEE